MTAPSQGTSFLEYYQRLIEQEKGNWDYLDKISKTRGRDEKTAVEHERAEIERRYTHVMRQMMPHLVPRILGDGLRGINWLCSEKVVNHEGAWGRSAYKDSRVLNTMEACTALSAWQELYTHQQNPPAAIRSIVNRLPGALKWATKKQDEDGAFIGLTFELAAVHNTAIVVWVVCTFTTCQSDPTIDWKGITSNAISWLHNARKSLKLSKSYEFFGLNESSASRTFASIWALRALIAYVRSPFASEQSLWDADNVGNEILNFLEAARLSTHHRPEWQYLMGHKVAEGPPSPAITGMLLTMLAEAQASEIPLPPKEIEQYIASGIDYLCSTVSKKTHLWEEETETYEQIININPYKTTDRHWTHVATPWCIQALALHNQYLNSIHHQILLIQSVMALLGHQSNEGYFRQNNKIEPNPSIFATALNLYALTYVLKFVEKLPLMEEVGKVTARTKTKVFISYSHNDTLWLDRLKVHLKLIEREGFLDCWDDTKIAPGDTWKDTILEALKSSKVAVLLISAHFLASDFIAKYELPTLLSRAASGGTTILPIIVSPCLFERTELRKFQTVNTPKKPLSVLSDPEREQVLVNVAERIIQHLDSAGTIQ